MVYIIYRSNEVFRVYLDRDLAHEVFYSFAEEDTMDEYTWSITGYRIIR